MTDRKNIPTPTKLKLFAASAGYCQKPECLQPLFPSQMGGEKHIAEMAHVIPHGKKGPRFEERPLEDFNPDAFENLILLCPTCHTIVDKAPEAYPRAVMLAWKENHLAELARSQGIRAYETRGEVREAIAARLQENKAIWEETAPIDGSDFEYDPESDTAKKWSNRMRSVILPNHFHIQSIIAINTHHAREEEKRTIAEYQEHVRGLVERHVCDEAGTATRFPKEMETIFE